MTFTHLIALQRKVAYNFIALQMYYKVKNIEIGGQGGHRGDQVEIS